MEGNWLATKSSIINTTGPENMVSTTIQLDNPNADGTCHNLDSNFIEVDINVYHATNK